VSPPVLKVGWHVHAVTRIGAGFLLRSGLVKGIDFDGVRITLMDWAVGAPVGVDVYLPWRNVEYAEVYTEEDYLNAFADDARRLGVLIEGLWFGFLPPLPRPPDA
jgi:hypothetical protein